jgi:uncharacterized protein (DUF488 family)
VYASTAGRTADVLTIGHSNLPADRFLALLKSRGIAVLGDVRSVPFSRRFPWFSSRALAERLREHGISYVAMGDNLGGRPADPTLYCEGIADYEAMARSPNFRAGLEHLTTEMGRRRLCLMCAEREPLDCHRCLLIGRALASRGYAVGHILADGAIELQAETEERLLAGSSDGNLLGDRNLRLAAAYRNRSQNVAARMSDRGRPGRKPRFVS